MGFKRHLFLFAFVLFAASAACFGELPKHAVVIIDMQPKFETRGGSADKPDNVEKVKKLTAAQVTAIKNAKLAKAPILIVEYDGYGDTKDDLKKELTDYKDVKYFIKNSDGMFEDYNKSKKDIVDHLKAKGIDTLIIMGANGGACVRSSITGAIENKFNVIAFSKGIADFNFDDFMWPYNYKDIKETTFKEVGDIETVNATLGLSQKEAPAPPALPEEVHDMKAEPGANP